MYTCVEPVAQLKTEVLGGRAAVSSSHPLVSLAGIRVLERGGNAIDASLAMAAVAWMVLPGQCGIGGDVFAIVREPHGQVWTVGGSGFGPDGGHPEFYRERGLSALPLTGALAVAVPGALAAIRTLHATGASEPLEDLWRPAVELGHDGTPCTRKTLADITEHAADLARDSGARDVFLAGGTLPRLGQRLYQRDLAETIAAAAEGTEGFYSGDFAELAVASLRQAGAPFTGEEWAHGEHVPVGEPISIGYGTATLHQTGLPSAGWMVAQQAGICDGLIGDRPLLDPESVHLMASAARRAFDDRLEHVGSDTDAWRRLLEPAALAEARRRVLAGPVSGAPVAAAVYGDTTSTVAVDDEGRAVSFIHSLAFTFGARFTVPGTGVVLNNRLGRGAYLIDGHPNLVRPRRRPLHTLNAWLVDDRHGLRHVGNCPGGDGQVQWNMQVISHLVDHGCDPQTAVSLPRFTVFPGSDADVIGQRPELRCEEGLPETTLAALRHRGHRVRRVPVQRGGPGGSALAVSVDRENGMLRAAADPRMEGTALAI